jgi:chromosome segregation ATPase
MVPQKKLQELWDVLRFKAGNYHAENALDELIRDVETDRLQELEEEIDELSPFADEKAKLESACGEARTLLEKLFSEYEKLSSEYQKVYEAYEETYSAYQDVVARVEELPDRLTEGIKQIQKARVSEIQGALPKEMQEMCDLFGGPPVDVAPSPEKPKKPKLRLVKQGTLREPSTPN